MGTKMSFPVHPPVKALDKTTAAFMEMARAQPVPEKHPTETETLEESRTGYDNLLFACGLEGPSTVSVQDFECGNVPCRLYRPSKAKANAIIPCVQYMHGGGGTKGSIAGYDNFCRILCERSRCAIVSVGYRLAPENPPPLCMQDCVTVFEYLTSAEGGSQLSIDHSSIGLVGDSAGGQVVVGLCCTLQKQNLLAKVRFQMPIQPLLCTQAQRKQTESYKSFDGPEYVLTHEYLDYFERMYLSDGAAPDEFRYPLLKESFAGFPPAVVITGGYDPMRDEGFAYHERLQADGCKSEYVCFNSIHVFFLLGKYIGRADSALTTMAAKLQRGMGIRPSCISECVSCFGIFKLFG